MNEKMKKINIIINILKDKNMLQEYFLNKNYIDIITDIMDFTQDLGLNLLSEVFKLLEKEFDKSIDRSKWHVHGWRSREIWTPLGDLKIKRHIYKRNSRRGETKILFDAEYGLEPHKYVQGVFAPIFLKMITKAKSYESLSEIFNYKLSTSTISRLVINQNIYVIPKKIRDKTDVLYVNVDDIYVKQHHGPKYCKRMVLAYTDRKKATLKPRKKKNKGEQKQQNSRNKSIEKTFLEVDTSLSIPEQAHYVETTMIKIYGDIKLIKLIGDGASWITSYANYFSKITVEREIDPFHYHSYIKKFLGRDKYLNFELFTSLTKEKALNYIATVQNNKDVVVVKGNIFDLKTNKKVKLNKLKDDSFRKIKRFYHSFCKSRLSWHPNAIEGIQSHYIASDLKGRRLFSMNVAKKISLMNIVKYNGWELTSDPSKGILLEKICQSNDFSNITDDDFSNLPGLDDGGALGLFLNAILK